VGSLIVGLGALASATGHAEFPLPVPNATNLLGLDLFAQPVTLHPGALGFGNGLRLRIGW
jgi:hypothetical protein